HAALPTGPGRALHAAKLERVEPVEQLVRVEQELLHPQRDALPDGRELRRLEVGVREARQLAVATRQLREGDDDGRDPSQQQLQPLAHQQEVGVVGDVRAGRAEVKEGTRRRRLLAKMMDVRHHVVPQALFVLGRAVEIGVVEVVADLGQRAIGDVEPELLLGLQQREPEPPPQPDPPALAPQRLHRGGGVAGAERRGVGQTGAFARATRLFQSARNCSSPRSVRGCSNSFFRMSGGSVATSAPTSPASVIGILTTMLSAILASSPPSRSIPSVSSATTSAETGPSTSEQISFSTSFGSRSPACLASSDGLVVTPSINPAWAAQLMSLRLAVSRKNFMTRPRRRGQQDSAPPSTTALEA